MPVTQVNLHNHTDGSFLDGLQTVKQAARRAKEVGSDALAINDHNEVNQHFAFQKACQAEGVHHVLGIEADWVYDVQWTRDNLPYPSNRSHICLLAETDEGLSNIWKLATLAYTEQYRYNKPLITPELMREHSAGVWASDGCALTEMARAIQKGDEELARQHFSMLLDIYGNHFYSELHTFQFINPEPEDKLKWNGEIIPVTKANEIMRDLNQAKLRFAIEMGVPLVVVNDSHHSRPEDWVNKDLVWKFSTHKKKGEEGDQEVEATLQKADHLMGGEEIYGWMAMHGIGREVVDQCIANSHAIAHSCHAEVRKTLDMPSLTGSATDDLKMLIAKVQKGFADKVTKEGLPEDVYFARVEEELSLIAAKGFPGYFLVVEDECEAAVSGRWAPYIKANAKFSPQLIGPGRGSAGGSLVAWLTGITSIDPIHYDLLFERFLAPGRKGLPDIDVDFPQSQRAGEKEYLSARYGHDHVCSIGTLSHSQPKGLLKDLARAMGVFDKAPGDVISMSKIVEQVQGIETEETAEGGEEAATWEQVVQAKGGELASWVRKYPELFAKINEFYQATEGDGPIRNSGIHASGVVVANKPLLGAIPLRSRPKDGEPVTQLDMFEVEELGAVKLDILGLRHLDTLMQARNMVYQRHGIWLDFRRDDLPPELRGSVGGFKPPDATVVTFGYDHYADPEIWPQVANGGTAGFFQIESGLLTRAAAELKPQNERDVAALISIVRPGVKDAGLDKAYLQRRAGVEDVVYDHPLMEPITSETYGVLIYQEQLLRSVRDLANFTPDEASDLQKALSKKWMDKVIAFKEKFVDGCGSDSEYMRHFVIDEGRYDEERARSVATKIWASIEASGRYAFNKSHAVGYAVISTWEIWTKHYYPTEFIAALMATDSENINVYIREARRRGIAILPPDVNESGRKFTLTDTAIRYGLDTLHGLGDAGVTELLAKRPFTGLEDLVERCDAKKGMGKTQVEGLIKIGAMEGWGSRHDLFVAYQDLQIWKPVADGVKAKKNTPELRAEHIAAWREKHAGEAKYEAEFGAASVPDFNDEAVIYAIEQELVGNFVTSDPMDKYAAAVSAVAIAHPSQIQGFEPKDEFVIGGQVAGIKVIKIKKEGRNKGRDMAFLSVDWNQETFEITLFPDVYEVHKAILVEGAPVACAVIRDGRGCNLKYAQRLDQMAAKAAS